MWYVLATQVNDQKTQRQLTAAGFVVITQRQLTTAGGILVIYLCY